MIGIVLVTHGRLADEFLSAMQHIVGPQNQIATACIGPNDDMNERRNDILNKVQAVDSGHCFDRYVWRYAVQPCHFDYGPCQH